MNPLQEAYINGVQFAAVNVQRYGIPATLDSVRKLETQLSVARRPFEARRFIAGACDQLLAIAQGA